MKTAALERVITRGRVRPSGLVEPCALCGAPVPADHPHVLDTESHNPLCVCRPCSLLFEKDAASLGHYRTIPGHRTRVAGIDPAKLRVPVGLAFFVVGDGGEVTAHYPSPAGATRWEVEPADWEAAVSRARELAGLAPQVQALLVNTAKGLSEAWIVPVSDCYRLVGIVVGTWEGLSGGDRVWKAIEEFFVNLRSDDGTDTGR